MIIKFRQQNLRKSKVAHEHLVHDICKTDDIIFLQETYNYKNKITGLPKSFQAYGNPGGRAAIIAPKKFNLWFCPEFSSRDYSVCLMHSNKKKIFLISAYLHEDLDPTQGLEQILNSLNFSDSSMIIAMDSNAHSQMWGSQVSNHRGEKLEEFILSNQLNVCNIGNKYTFVSHVGKSVIDITLNYGPVMVQNWYVSDEHRHSDHKCIFFEATIDVPKEKPHLNVTKCNWDIFGQSLPANMVFYLEWSNVTIEHECEVINKSIHKSLKKSCPLNKPGKPKSWWSNELKQKSDKAKVLWLKAIKSKLEADFELSRQANKDLSKSIRKAKKSRWTEFCEGVVTPKQMAKLNKSIFRKDNQSINLLKYSDGSFSRSPDEVSNILFETHFPGNERPEMATEMSQNGIVCRGSDLKGHFITETLVEKAFESFGPLKSPGPDDIKPIVLQHLDMNMIKRITNLYRACITIGYTPKPWRKSKIVFIPKPGKGDYTLAKSFRPISLTSFIWKGLERIVSWHLETTTLVENPISKYQHAFTKNHSCESALSSMVDSIESGLAVPKGKALGTFLDVEGAFDNLCPEAINKAMIEKNFPNEIRKWYNHYQHNRLAESEILGFKSSRKLVKGVAQGGVLSSLMWLITFDSLLQKINDSGGPVKAYGYADDCALLVRGIDCSIMVSYMQEAVNKVVNEWGPKNGLKFSQVKTECIWFYREYKWVDPVVKVNMYGIPIEYTSKVKWLGVTLDSKLSWKNHVEEKISKCKKHLMAMKYAFGTMFGPNPRMLLWAYKGIILPALTYGAVVWGKVTAHDKAIQLKLKKLNRLISLLMMPLRKGTPTDGIEVILNLVPLDLEVQKATLKGYLRVIESVTIVNSKWIDAGKGRRQGHHKWCSSRLQGMDVSPNHDRKKFLNLETFYNVDLKSKLSGQPNCNTNLVCYTDGSKMNNRSGYGVFISKDNYEVESTYGALGSKTSVYQAEVYAIHKCCELLSKMEPEPVTIFTDNQSALVSLAQMTGKSTVVQQCIDSLNKLAKSRSVTIKWIKAHFDHCGNEMADALAKSGTENTLVEEAIPPPISYANFRIKEHIKELWLERWTSKSNKEFCKQTKIWFPKVNEKLSKHLINLNKLSLGRVVQGITGHNFLMRHETLINPGKASACRLCQKAEETFWHLIGECEALYTLRVNIFHDISPTLPKNPEWKVHQIQRFVESPQVKRLMVRQQVPG